MLRNIQWFACAFVVSGVAACSGDDGQSGSGAVGGATFGQGGQPAGQGGSTVHSTAGAVAVGGASNLVTAGGPAAGGGSGAAGGSGGTVTAIAGGSTSTAGASSSPGGSTARGGSASTAGSTSKGGTTSTGGTTAKGGTTSTGGTTAKGGTSSTGGATAKGGTSSTGGATAKGGTSSTGGAAACTAATWDPPPSVATGVNEVWDHTLNHGGSSYGQIIMASTNIKIYQIMANKGSLNYCVRWDSTTKINATERDQIEALIARCDKQWTDALAGWGCWPYTDVPVKVSLWAVKDRALLDWDDSTTTAKVVVNSTAECPSDCGPWNPNNAHSNCSSAKYDEFFWLDGATTTYTGWGSATGFMMGASFFLQAAKSNAATQNITVHEMGHSHGLDDFYDWTPTGFTTFVMKAGPQATVTEADKWMLRDVWRHVRSRYGYPAP